MDYSFYSTPNPQQPYPLYNLHGLPTPNQVPRAEDAQGAFPHLGQHIYQSYDPSLRLTDAHGIASFVAPPHSPPESLTKQSVSSNDVAHPHFDRASLEADEPPADFNPGRSSSEEKDTMTPAQSKRKAQNRAAQRAFRERKERHVRELEEKVNNLEQESNTLMADNERLKRELARFTTENEILKATSGSFRSSSQQHSMNSEPTTTGPLQYSPTDFNPNPKSASGELPPRHRVTTCQVTGERLLDAGATWEYIQSHELFKRGSLNIADVYQRLKGAAQCDGTGPAFRESEVRKAIEESSAACSDELI
ncbi:putative bZIP transcription factor (Fcr3) [Aspergillus saccharolyticus JOP 1030-1]|uniref:Putative bZIP transcription factor n=1 Tax=Aspergillus saccharolyticus JOP 1030-1 TaxID=1450539 RepID=A0A318Z118_9EURO|nr:putative bZIP transcription factor [Aspergillus saccharolyticus JOP 1030-1]PYH40975.1 putative bZIP transcription factor [Aspergillus saccharolyticus JOP 1030-1]